QDIQCLEYNKLNSTADEAFEDSVSEVINFINDLPDTLRTRFRKECTTKKNMRKPNKEGDIQPHYKAWCDDTTPVTKMLFGDDIKEKKEKI
ncbi:Hypothetical predicted protein, partial [Mytilus galloprovincialis]